MCEEEDHELLRAVTDISFFGENTWEELDQKQVQKGGREELDRFCKMGAYDCASRDTATRNINGKFGKVKWIRTKKGSGVRCRLVAQELGYRVRLDELFAGTPPLGAVRLAVVDALKHTHCKNHDHEREVRLVTRRNAKERVR